MLAQARKGDVHARCEIGRRYLLGINGFPQHTGTGLDYLCHASVDGSPQAAKIIVENLPLNELLALNLHRSLNIAAAAGSVAAQVKLGSWLCTQPGRLSEGLDWLKAAAAGGHSWAQCACEKLAPNDDIGSVLATFQSMSNCPEVNVTALALAGAREAVTASDVPRLLASLRAWAVLNPKASMPPEFAQLVVASVVLAEAAGLISLGIEPATVEASLEARCDRGDRDAAYALGRALCELPVGAMQASVLVTSPNQRKGSALLLRAADAGCNEAWLHLYRLHSHHRSSVANPQMARFFLEKAAASGQTEAQRKLGALMLRGSACLADTEQAIHWLFQAASDDDAHAKGLLQSLVLPLQGTDVEAAAVISDVRGREAWLAIRLQLSRDFGLTKLEALTVDPVKGLRPWGLVVGHNPFIAQSRLSAPRAVPATSPAALEHLRQAAVFFEQARQETAGFEGDLRNRSLRQRRFFERHQLDEAMFFASVSSTTLDALRLGPKWAFRAKQTLRLALAA